jgi:hypothetical protein
VKELEAERAMVNLEAATGVILWLNEEWSRLQIAELLHDGDQPIESEDTDSPLA